MMIEKIPVGHFAFQYEFAAKDIHEFIWVCQILRIDQKEYGDRGEKIMKRFYLFKELVDIMKHNEKETCNCYRNIQELYHFG